MKNISRSVSVTLCVFLLFSIENISTLAQVVDRQWSLPIRLSREDGSVRNESNTIVADKYGFLHAFWIEQDSPDERYTIQYARFDGNTWSNPNDIFVAGQGTSYVIGDLSAATDQNGLIHLLWTGEENGPVFYSRSPIDGAFSAWNWIKPVRIDIPAYQISLQVDSQGILHVLYAQFIGDRPGVFYTSSKDQGETWSDPLWLDPDIPQGYRPLDPTLKLDKFDGVHALWVYVELIGSQAPIRWIRYAHSLNYRDNYGESWSSPFTIDADRENDDKLRAAGPLMAISGRTIHIIWAGDYQTHRKYRYSTDAGETWSTPTRIFGDLEGQAGDGITIDEAGRVHYFGQIRYPQGIYHAYLDQGYWSLPNLIYLIQKDAFDPIGDRIHAHNLRAAVRAGDQLVITFTDPPGVQQELYAMYVVSEDVFPRPSLLLPTLSSVSTPAKQSSRVLPTQVPTRPTNTWLKDERGSDLLDNYSPATALFFGLVPTIMLVCAIAIYRNLKKR